MQPASPGVFLALICTGEVAFFSPMRALMGRAALYLVAIILALTLLQSLLDWNAKQRADNRLFDRGEKGE